MTQSAVYLNATLKWDEMPAPDADVDVVARTLWGEARGEGYDGMVAVANVIMNRARRGGWWGNTPREVCQKPWQFSCWNPTDPNLMKLLQVDASNPQFAMALEIAAAALAGNLPDITNGATNYKVRGWPASWAASMTLVARIGNHDFYA
ncbi:MAG: cell wall hydrolase [Bacteroidales bacterium]